MGPQKFIAANTAEALQLIRNEMGPDAMVLSTKDTSQGVEIIAITSQDLSNLSARSEALDPSFGEADAFSERSLIRSGLQAKVDNAIARRIPDPEVHCVAILLAQKVKLQNPSERQVQKLFFPPHLIMLNVSPEGIAMSLIPRIMIQSLAQAWRLITRHRKKLLHLTHFVAQPKAHLKPSEALRLVIL